MTTRPRRSPSDPSRATRATTRTSGRAQVVAALVVALAAASGCSTSTTSFSKAQSLPATSASPPAAPPTTDTVPTPDPAPAVTDEAVEAVDTPPVPSSPGDGALTWGNWEVVGKIQVDQDGLDDYDVVLRVRNIGEAVDSGIFTVTILKGTRILGTASCSTSDINPGSVGTAGCFSTDDFIPGWTEVVIEDSF
ncbi:hypothetical protein [Nocardioides sp. R-C-SC26]|uniref:hypothetical protein n=1 Tax=Nocardioides sp. R-C-SC26 TaxID=2870414 RepID=UPI001E377478|nr:hypothetical protein [Nocardioides sp. R-C-SC26]